MSADFTMKPSLSGYTIPKTLRKQELKIDNGGYSMGNFSKKESYFIEEAM